MASTCTACNHPVTDHGRIPGVGCMEPKCPCEYQRQVLERNADKVATDEALERVENGTDPAWAALARAAVRTLADRGAPFTTDDVWDYLADQDVAAPREPRALGPIMKAAGTDGTLRLEGYASSRRRHGSLLRSYVGAR